MSKGAILIVWRLEITSGLSRAFHTLVFSGKTITPIGYLLNWWIILRVLLQHERKVHQKQILFTRIDYYFNQHRVHENNT